VSRPRVWGCGAYVLTPKQERDGKLDRLSKPAISVGYDNGDLAYRVRLEDGRLVSACNARFDESQEVAPPSGSVSECCLVITSPAAADALGGD
jgi:hypothetical protein